MYRITPVPEMCLWMDGYLEFYEAGKTSGESEWCELVTGAECGKGASKVSPWGVTPSAWKGLHLNFFDFL